jgi:hypothetical protein
MRVKNLVVAAALGGAAAVAPLAASPALAFTPGHVCDIYVAAGPGSIHIPGTIAQDGNTCTPNTPLSGPLAQLNVGVACGAYVPIGVPPYVSPVTLARAICYT